MADVTIDAAASISSLTGQRALVFTSASVGYLFFCDADAPLKYTKTTDGGSSWISPVSVSGVVGIVAFDVFFDGEVASDTGTIIHIAWADSNTDGVRYRSLDTSSDTLGTERTVAGDSALASGLGMHVSITKAGGQLYVVINGNASPPTSSYRSTDGGINWTTRTSLFEVASGDVAWLFPGNATDPKDVWALFLDASAVAITLKTIDDSANTVSESSTIVPHTQTGTYDTWSWPLGAARRQSDGHLIVAVATAVDSATGDLRVFDINGAGSITELTAITTDIDDIYYPQVWVNPGNNDIHVGYIGKRDGSQTLGTTVGVYYTKSTDGGATWSAGDTAYSNGTGNYRNLWASRGRRFLMSWRTSAQVILTNFTNSVVASTAVSLAGNQPSASGRLQVLQPQSLQGNQPSSAGVVSSQRVYSARSVAGNQPAASGGLTVTRGRFVSLAGDQPYSPGELVIDPKLRHLVLLGDQPFATGSPAVRWLSAHRTLTGSQAAAVGRIYPDPVPRQRVPLAAGRVGPAQGLAAGFAGERRAGH